MAASLHGWHELTSRPSAGTLHDFHDAAPDDQPQPQPGPRVALGGGRSPTMHTVPNWDLKCYTFARHSGAKCLRAFWHLVFSASSVPEAGWNLSSQFLYSVSIHKELKFSVP